MGWAPLGAVASGSEPREKDGDRPRARAPVGGRGKVGRKLVTVVVSRSLVRFALY